MSRSDYAELNSYMEHWLEGFCSCQTDICIWRDIRAGVELHGAEGAD